MKNTLRFNDDVAQHEDAGGKAIIFGTPVVSDGISMGTEAMKYSLVSREVIADSVELVVRGHAYDGLVAFGGCDKNLPAMMMAMVRLNVPSVFIYGGSILPGKVPAGADVPEDFATRDLTVQDMFEAVGRHQAGDLSDAALDILERVACPSAGACGGSSPAAPSCPRRRPAGSTSWGSRWPSATA